MIPRHLAETKVSEIISDATFQAFVYDFYHSLPDREDPPSAGVILQEVFSSDALFREFLLFCRENQYSSLWVEAESQRATILFQSLLYLKEIHKQHIESILNASFQNVYNKMSTSSIGQTEKFQWDALQKSIENGVAINNRWEIIYTLEDINGGYKVFSYESKEHEVNYNWEVLRDNLRNKWERIMVLKRLREYRDFLSYIQAIPGFDEASEAMKKIYGEFREETHFDDSQVVENIKIAKLARIKVLMYISRKIAAYERAFKFLQSEDRSSSESLSLVEEEHSWDGIREQSSFKSVEYKRSQIRAVT